MELATAEQNQTFILLVDVRLPLQQSQLQLQQITLSALTRNDTTNNRNCATMHRGDGIQAVRCSSQRPVICEQRGKIALIMLNSQESKLVVFRTTVMACMIRIQLASIHVVASLYSRVTIIISALWHQTIFCRNIGLLKNLEQTRIPLSMKHSQ